MVTKAISRMGRSTRLGGVSTPTKDRDEVLLLTKLQIESVLTMEDAIDVVAEGFKAYNSGRAIVPFPVALQVPDHAGDIHIKPGYIRGYPTYTVKIASGFYDNAKLNLPSSHGMLLVFDSETGWPVCLEVDRGMVTDLRTAAAGAVAARALAKESIERVAVIGTGVQARLQIQALAKVRRFKDLAVWGRNPAKVDHYVREMSEKIDAEVSEARTVKEAVAGSDVIVTATMSTEPLVYPEWISKGSHVTAVGSDSPEKQELATGVLALADKIVCDSIKQCAQLGELHHAIEDGTIEEKDVHGELGEVLLGVKPGRESDDEITICDLTGLAVQDVVTSQLVFERALSGSIGSFIKV